MIFFRDKTYCSDAERCANKEGCDRYFSAEEKEAAIRWWGNDRAPVAYSPFAQICSEFVEKKWHYKTY